MAIQPQFVTTPNVGIGAIATANANRDGTGTIGTIWSAGSNGGRIDYVFIKATVTTTAGTVRLYVYEGSTYTLIAEVLVSAITASATVAAWTGVWTPPGGYLVLETGQSLRASTEKAENFNLVAVGGDF